MREHGQQIHADAGLVVVHVAGRERSRPCRASVRRSFAGALVSAPPWLARGIFRRQRRDPGVPVDAELAFHHATPEGRMIHRIRHLHHDRDAGNLPCVSVDARNFFGARDFALLYFTALARSIRCGKSTFHSCGGVYGHFVSVADIAQIALVDHFHVIGLGDAVHLHGRRFIDQVNSVGNALHRFHAAAAAVADVVNTLKLMVQLCLRSRSPGFSSRWRGESGLEDCLLPWVALQIFYCLREETWR